jgi:spore coat protein U-like protein
MTRKHPCTRNRRPFRRLFTFGLGLAVLAFIASPAGASTATNTFTATITVQASCLVVSTNTLDFGTQSTLAANTDVSATFAVQCTNTTPYNVGLNAGTTAGGTVATRLMTSGSATISYRTYSNAARTTNWGNTVGTDTVSGTGNGAQQTLTVYGRVPVQATPAPATYNDTVTITVTY